MLGATHQYIYDYYPVNEFNIRDEYKDVVSWKDKLLTYTFDASKCISFGQIILLHEQQIMKLQDHLFIRILYKVLTTIQEMRRLKKLNEELYFSQIWIVCNDAFTIPCIMEDDYKILFSNIHKGTFYSRISDGQISQFMQNLIHEVSQLTASKLFRYFAYIMKDIKCVSQYNHLGLKKFIDSQVYPLKYQNDSFIQDNIFVNLIQSQMTENPYFYSVNLINIRITNLFIEAKFRSLQIHKRIAAIQLADKQYYDYISLILDIQAIPLGPLHQNLYTIMRQCGVFNLFKEIYHKFENQYIECLCSTLIELIQKSNRNGFTIYKSIHCKVLCNYLSKFYKYNITYQFQGAFQEEITSIAKKYKVKQIDIKQWSDYFIEQSKEIVIVEQAIEYLALQTTSYFNQQPNNHQQKIPHPFDQQQQNNNHNNLSKDNVNSQTQNFLQDSMKSEMQQVEKQQDYINTIKQKYNDKIKRIQESMYIPSTNHQEQGSKQRGKQTRQISDFDKLIDLYENYLTDAFKTPNFVSTKEFELLFLQNSIYIFELPDKYFQHLSVQLSKIFRDDKIQYRPNINRVKLTWQGIVLNNENMSILTYPYEVQTDVTNNLFKDSVKGQIDQIVKKWIDELLQQEP